MPLLYRSSGGPTRHQSVDDPDHGKHEQDMYQRADHGTKGKKADQPADNEEDNYDIQEVVHLS